MKSMKILGCACIKWLFCCAACISSIYFSVLIISSDLSAAEIVYRCEGLEEKSPRSLFNVKMYQGYDGWFFRKVDLESMFEFPDNTIEMLSRVSEALSSRGTHLILMPMLPRGLAGAKFIPNGGILSDLVFDEDLSRQQFNGMIDALKAAGIDVVNVDEIIKENPDFDKGKFYFKRDIHWRPEGARIVADFVARHIVDISEEKEGKVDYVEKEVGVGRLIQSNFNVILNELCQSKIPSEKLMYYDVKRRVSSLDEIFEGADGGGGQFLHVVGSSFTDDTNPYHFNDFLRKNLRQEVAGFAIKGGGVNQSIYAWAQNQNGLEKKPRFLIWEFADFVDLRKLTENMNSSLVPAIVGGCEGELKLAEKAFEKTAEVELDLPALVGKATDYYLAYDFSNKALTSFQSTYAYGNGATKIVPFENPTRVSGLVKLFQALPGGTKTAPVHVRLDLQGGAQSAGSVKLCRYPNGIFQDAATSN